MADVAYTARAAELRDSLGHALSGMSVGDITKLLMDMWLGPGNWDRPEDWVESEAAEIVMRRLIERGDE